MLFVKASVYGIIVDENRFQKQCSTYFFRLEIPEILKIKPVKAQNPPA